MISGMLDERENIPSTLAEMGLTTDLEDTDLDAALDLIANPQTDPARLHKLKPHRSRHSTRPTSAPSPGGTRFVTEKSPRPCESSSK